MKKILWFDCETTGLNHWENGIWQYAAIKVIEGKVTDRLEIQCLPIEGSVINPESLVAVGKQADFLEGETLIKGEQAFFQFREWIGQNVDRYNKQDKYVLAGYNVRFDEGFLRTTWKKMGDKFFGSYFTKPPLDAMQAAMEALGPEWLKLPDHKLQTVAERILGQEARDADWHDAVVDIEMTMKIYEKVRGIRA